MKKHLIIISASIIMIAGAAFAQESITGHQAKDDKCLICHIEMELLPEHFTREDVHIKAGLSCQGCHGGDLSSEDPDISMSESRGFIGVPAKKDIPRLCGKCHSNIDIMRVFRPRITTDQEAQYYTSVHGKKLKQGDENVADCASCHTAHAVFSAKDPRSTVYAINVPVTCDNCHGDKELMSEYGLEGNEVEEYKQGVHGIALLENKDTGAPACNDCHGNHGAVPPGIVSISHVCGTCHVNNAEYFNNSGMAAAFEGLDYHGCEQCHGNHLIAATNDYMVGVGEESMCVDCHSEGDNGFDIARNIKLSLDNLVAHYDSAAIKLQEVENKGMNEVEIGFLLQGVRQDLIQSRTLVHTFDSIIVKEKTDDGLSKARSAIQLADSEIDEYYSRRNGFALATLSFLILIVALYFKLKDMVKRKNS